KRFAQPAIDLAPSPERIDLFGQSRPGEQAYLSVYRIEAVALARADRMGERAVLGNDADLDAFDAPHQPLQRERVVVLVLLLAFVSRYLRGGPQDTVEASQREVIAWTQRTFLHHVLDSPVGLVLAGNRP